MYEIENIDKIFTKSKDKHLDKKKFEDCRFLNCNFVGTDFRDTYFIDCIFENCDLSLAKINGAKIHRVEFIGCKLAGWNFSRVNKILLSVDFDKCKIQQSDFSDIKLKNKKFIHCDVSDTDFSGCDLSGSNFHKTKFKNCFFQNCDLRECDFSKAEDFVINPLSNKLRKAKFDYPGVLGLVSEFGIIIK